MLGSLSLIKYEPFVTTKVTNQNNYIEKSISIHNGQEIVQKRMNDMIILTLEWKLE